MRPSRLSGLLRCGIRTRDLSVVGSRSNSALHHATNSSVFFSAFSSVFSSAHTSSVALVSPSANPEPLKIPGGIGAHGLSGFEPEPFGLATEVTVNFTIPGSCLFAKNFCYQKIYAVPVA